MAGVMDSDSLALISDTPSKRAFAVLSDHVDMRDAKVVIGIRDSLEAEALVVLLEVALGADADRAGSNRVEDPGHQASVQAALPQIAARHDSAENDLLAIRVPACIGRQLAVFVGQQMRAQGILAIHFRVGT